MEKNRSEGLQPMHFAKAIVIAALITVLLLFVCAFLMLKTGIEEKVLAILVAGVDAVATFAGGVYIGRKSGKQKFLWGLLFGGIYFLIYLMLVFLMNGIEIEVGAMIKSLLVMAVGGMIGGMVS
ncbi:MAG: TIGR04086 family membrane protein [Lachnospiraceae bacterium]|nr:TIGR04086 family membrane protein [Lachnospiraceae bacterium]